MIFAFDLFGTIFDMGAVPRDEIKSYLEQIKREPWKPLKLSDAWESLPAFPDSAEGIARLRRDHWVVTMSNAPLGLQARISKRAGISWDLMIPLELFETYKPDLAAYRTITTLLGTQPKDIVMVTANRTFGDIEAAMELGMQAQCIRGEWASILDLANMYKAREAGVTPQYSSVCGSTPCDFSHTRNRDSQQSGHMST